MRRAFVCVMVLAGAWLIVGADGASSEQLRLRSHFDSVLVELESRDVRGLTTAQRSSRAQLIGWLADYRDAGRFPLNDRYAAVPTPIFRDARGVTCAMAYLIERSGRADIVDDVSATRNLAYIDELADDIRLVAWLDSVGFDIQEAARVQPTYGTPESRRNVDKEYAVASMMVSGASLVTATWNLAKPSRAVGVLGLITGGFTVLAGLGPANADATQTDGDRAVGTIDIFSGGAAIIAGLWAFGRNESRGSSSPVRESRAATWSLAVDPILRSANGGKQIRLGMLGRF